MSAMLFTLIFPRAQRAGTFDNSTERNVWLQSALRSLRSSAIIWKQLSLRSFAIRDSLRSSAIIWKLALSRIFSKRKQCNVQLSIKHSVAGFNMFMTLLFCINQTLKQNKLSQAFPRDTYIWIKSKTFLNVESISSHMKSIKSKIAALGRLKRIKIID